MLVFITDFIIKADIEKKILGKYLSNSQRKDISVLLVWHQKCNKAFLENFPNLKVIIRYGVGVDNIDLNYAKKNNIKVANTPDYGVDEVSDTAITFLMMLTRKNHEYNEELKNLNDYQNIWQERRKKKYLDLLIIMYALLELVELDRALLKRQGQLVLILFSMIRFYLVDMIKY